jgi:hypothetical protein
MKLPPIDAHTLASLIGVTSDLALVIDKDQNPQWKPARVEDVTTEMVEPFFQSPWPVFAHPLKDLV